MSKTPRTTRRLSPRAAKRAAELRAFNEAEAARAEEVVQPEEPVVSWLAEQPDPPTARQEFDDPIEGPLEVPEGELARLAHEINSRLTIADAYTNKSNDHQLAVALQLARVKAICRERKINFRSWAETNLPPTRSYQMIRKLANAGESEDPQAALNEWRARNAMRMRQRAERIRSQIRPSLEAPRQSNVVKMQTEQPADVLASEASIPPSIYDMHDRIMMAIEALPSPEDKRQVAEAALQMIPQDQARIAVEKVFGPGSLAA